MGNGDQLFNELKHDLDKWNTTFFDTLRIIRESTEYYDNNLQILKHTYTPDVARQEMKRRAQNMVCTLIPKQTLFSNLFFFFSSV